MTEEVSETSKYASLLKPIKELASNWNIDIAGELVEYLDVLENIEICFDETGESKLNFAEAALLIQGSTMVYSKKVEFLYNLVYQTLDLLCDNKGDDDNNNGGNRTRRRRTAIDDEEKYENDKKKFLLLDDVVPLANAKTSITLKLPTTSKDKKKYMSQALKQPFPHALMAGRSDIGLAESSQSLKLMTCGVYNGAVILDDTLLKKSRFLKLKCKTPSTTESKNTINDGENGGINDHEDYDDDAGDACFDDGGYDDGDSMIDNNEHAAKLAITSPVNRIPVKETDEEEDEDDDNHFYDRLDPHDGAQLPSRPFKRGKTWLLPKRLKKDTEKEEAEGDDEYEQEEEHTSFVSMAKPTNPNPKRSLLYPEFAYFMSFQRRLQRKFKQVMKDVHQNDDNVENDNNQGYEEGDEYDEYDAGGDDYDDDDDGRMGEDDGDLIEKKLDMDDMDLDSKETDSYLDLVKKHVQSYLRSANEWALQSSLDKRVKQWQEKITPVLRQEKLKP
mmetsp:Transcript_33513/g.41110  ORF Transcript_33513/g.41110 Transcript_33513/m.41110 type:complete len:502 (+) Transcript_33513:217-1722(+)